MNLMISTANWALALEFWRKIVALHDSTLSDVQFSPALDTLILEFREVLSHSEEHGFSVVYPCLRLDMTGVENPDLEQLRHCIEGDVVSAELLPNELWVNTMLGSFSFQFRSLSFRDGVGADRASK